MTASSNCKVALRCRVGTTSTTHAPHRLVSHNPREVTVMAQQGQVFPLAAKGGDGASPSRATQAVSIWAGRRSTPPARNRIRTSHFKCGARCACLARDRERSRGHRCLAPVDDLERSWLEAVEYLAEPRHPFLVAGEGTPTPDGRHIRPGAEADERLRVFQVAEEQRELRVLRGGSNRPTRSSA
jgi:hypothetical protein